MFFCFGCEKPENILINSESDKVVICDLGSAKNVDDGTYNKAYMCSRLYRAPELLCNCELYCEKIGKCTSLFKKKKGILELFFFLYSFPKKQNNNDKKQCFQAC